jgi:uncharacterized protein (TIGR03435 family)
MRLSTLAAFLLASLHVCAQSFEVASIKPVEDGSAGGMHPTPLAHSGGPGTSDPTRLIWPNATLASLTQFAYGIKPFQLTGPAWMDSQHYQLEARVPAGAAASDMPVMMKNLLAQRFRLVARNEIKELPLYAIVVAKSGSKLKQAAAEDPAPKPPSSPNGAGKPDAYGFPRGAALVKPGEWMMSLQPGRTTIVGKAIPVSALADRLSYVLARPVTDSTGLTAKYDIVLTYSTEGVPNGGIPAAKTANPDDSFVPGGEPVQELFGAIQAQLGLRLESRRGPVSTIIIEKADRTPTGN